MILERNLAVQECLSGRLQSSMPRAFRFPTVPVFVQSMTICSRDSPEDTSLLGVTLHPDCDRSCGSAGMQRDTFTVPGHPI